MQFTSTQKSVMTWASIAAVKILLLWLLGPV
ncbi:MAG: hypothetical protein RL535_1342, partial [Pseudomonadota bacterium]